MAEFGRLEALAAFQFEFARRHERLQQAEQASLSVFAKARDDAPPGNPKLLKAAGVGTRSNARFEERYELSYPLFIERRAETGPQTVACEHPEHSFVVFGPSPRGATFGQRVEQAAVRFE